MSASSRLWLRPCAVVLLALSVAVGQGAGAQEPSGPPQLKPLPVEPVKVELAPFMGELQRLTHKLSLSVAAGNRELAGFYAYESIELLREIQRQLPEYEGQPVALLIDRLMMPRMEALQTGLARPAAADSAPATEAALAGVIESCNECHRSTGHGFLRITSGRDVNPFNQDFAP